jgi:hypothetical protein
MLRLLQDGRLDHLGVSFDAHLFNRRRWRQYIHGGQAVLPKEFGPHGSLAWVLQFDYAVIVFELPRDARYTGNGRFVDLSGISPITLPEQDYLLDKVRGGAELPLTAVGYGMGEFLVGPGDASGATFDRSKEGDRWMAEYTSANSFMGREANILVGSQNPARGDEGTCYGDSGGPLFYEDQGVELQVAITSSGDFPCRSTAFMTRTDSARAVEFLGCVMAPGAELEDILACGCTEVNDARVCPGATGRGGRRGSRR